MKKTCENCYYEANGHKTYGGAIINCKMIGKRVRAHEGRQGCHNWRKYVADGEAACKLYGDDGEVAEVKDKDPKDLLRDCLEDIDDDLESAEKWINDGRKPLALNDIAKARGRIANLLTIMGYL